MQALIITAPQGAGKSNLAKAMAEFFGYTEIVDSWECLEPLPEGVLALTNIETIPPEFGRVMTLNEAKALMAAGK